MEKCIYCGSANLHQNIKIGLSAETGLIGLEFKAAILTRVEPFYADLCKDCGSVSRLHVENVDRNWRCK
jgi:hypothetical protein